jgi:nicotinamide mononucleotide (NMN) deamidase PncC
MADDLARFDADVACSTTGVAGPDGGSEGGRSAKSACAKTADGQRLPRDIVLPGS